MDFSLNEVVTQGQFNSHSFEALEEMRAKNDEWSGFVFLSLPAISDDGAEAIIYRTSICGGLRGGGSIIYLKRIESVWVVKHWHPLYVA